MSRRDFRLPWRTRAAIQHDLEDELSFHFEMRVAELRAQGLSSTNAHAAASSELGDLDDARRYIHSVDHAIDAASRRMDIMSNLLRTFEHAARRLRRAPIFTITSVLTMAIGIGACSLMMSLVSTVLLKPLPYPAPERIEMVWSYFPSANLGFPEQPTHGRALTLLRDNTRAYAALSGFRGASFNLGNVATPERLDGVEATGDFFHALGVSAQVGRFFERANETPGNDRVAVVSDGLWRRRFGADPNLVGRSLTLNGQPVTVIGIAPRGFAFPRGSEMPGDFQFAATPDIWVPLKPPVSGPSDLAIVGRLRQGVTHDASRKDMDRVITVIEESIPGTKGKIQQLIVPLRDQVVGHVQTMLMSLLLGVVLVLVIACVNTAQLFLAQLNVRRRDLAVRVALGASARRIAAEVFAEVAMIAAAGGIGGVVFGIGGLRVVRLYGASRLPRVSELTFDGRSAVAALVVTLIAAMLASILPMLIGSRVPLVDTLRAAGRGSGRATVSLRARRALIIGELAASLVLISGAGLLIRSLSKQLSATRGFTAAHGMTFELSLPPVRYPEQQQRTSTNHAAASAFITSALENLRAIPGVQAAAIGKPLPLSGGQEATVFTPDGGLPLLPDGTSSPIAEFTVASPDMFRALGTPIIDGRDISAADREESPPVVMINQSMAEWLWPGKPAVGRRLRVGPVRMTPPPPWMTVIGVVANMKRYSLTDSPRPEMIVPYTQNPYPTFSTMQFILRSNLDAGALLSGVRKAIAATDPSIPVASARTVDELVSASSANARFVTYFMTGFGVVALTLALIGVYGVIAYGVQQRRQEFGVRRALGAGADDIVGLILRQSAGIAGAGIALGIALAIGAGFSLRHLLYDISPVDPATLIGAIVVILLATSAASIVPAIAAARVEPRSALEE